MFEAGASSLTRGETQADDASSDQSPGLSKISFRTYSPKRAT